MTTHKNDSLIIKKLLKNYSLKIIPLFKIGFRRFKTAYIKYANCTVYSVQVGYDIWKDANSGLQESWHIANVICRNQHFNKSLHT